MFHHHQNLNINPMIKKMIVDHVKNVNIREKDQHQCHLFQKMIATINEDIANHEENQNQNHQKKEENQNHQRKIKNMEIKKIRKKKDVNHTEKQTVKVLRK